MSLSEAREVAKFHQDIRKIMKHLRTPEDVVEGLAMLALISIEEVRAVKEEFRMLIEQNPEGPVKRGWTRSTSTRVKRG
jgi:hypothetical protein